jgi:hypothetical protein
VGHLGGRPDTFGGVFELVDRVGVVAPKVLDGETGEAGRDRSP